MADTTRMVELVRSGYAAAVTAVTIGSGDGGCINLSTVLAPGGRLGVSDVVDEDGVSPEERAERGTWIGCVAGALSRTGYLDGPTAAGITEPRVDFIHEVAPGLHGAIIRAVKAPLAA